MNAQYSPLVKYPDVIKMTVEYDGREASVFIDKKNLERVKRRTWRVSNTGTIFGSVSSLDKFIMQATKKDDVIGYKNNNKNDLREVNLVAFKSNTYIINEDSDESILEIRAPRNPFTPDIVRFTTSDYPLLVQYNWHISAVSTPYPRAKRGGSSGMTIFMHVLILNRLLADDDMVIDHIDRQPLNNTRPNLHIVTKAFNARNRENTNKYGQPGIIYDAKMKRWTAYWKDPENPGKEIRIRFTDAKYGKEGAREAAIQARLEHERSTFGYLNSPIENKSMMK